MQAKAASLLVFLLCLGATGARGESPDTRPIKVDHLKIAVMMFSDAQNWTDYQILGGYRVQNRTGTAGWRLLDPNEDVLVKGTRETCTARLSKITEQKNLVRAEGEIVILLHGLFQTRATMEPMETQLKAAGGYQVVNFGYASTRADIESHAAAVAEVLKNLKPSDRVSFVGHSMGCIVVRKLLADGQGHPWKVGRVVMIGPPNQGAEMARRLSSYPIVRRWLGPGFEELARPAGPANLPTPQCEFALIAGASPRWLLNSPLIAGDDDWIVGVSETALAGAKCQTCVPAHHGNIVHDRAALEATLEFLKQGQFSKAITKEAK
jgi:pimeloyl-ACP methyl ester carboxylesterase